MKRQNLRPSRFLPSLLLGLLLGETSYAQTTRFECQVSSSYEVDGGKTESFTGLATVDVLLVEKDIYIGIRSKIDDLDKLMVRNAGLPSTTALTDLSNPSKWDVTNKSDRAKTSIRIDRETGQISIERRAKYAKGQSLTRATGDCQALELNTRRF